MQLKKEYKLLYHLIHKKTSYPALLGELEKYVKQHEKNVGSEIDITFLLRSFIKNLPFNDSQYLEVNRWFFLMLDAKRHLQIRQYPPNILPSKNKVDYLTKILPTDVVANNIVPYLRKEDALILSKVNRILHRTIFNFFQDPYRFNSLPSARNYCLTPFFSVISTFHDDQKKLLLPLPTGEFISTRGQMLTVWSRKNSQFTSTQILNGHTHSINKLILLSTGEFISAENGILKIWSRDKKGKFNCVQTIALAFHRGSTKTLIPLPNGNFLSDSSENTFDIWARDQHGRYISIQKLSGNIKNFINLYPSTWISISFDNKLKLWLHKDNKFSWLQTLELEHQITTIITLPNSRFITGNEKGKIGVWCLSGDNFQRIQEIDAHIGSIKNLLVISSTEIISAGSDGVLKVWSLNGNNIYECTQALKGYGWINQVIKISHETLALNSEIGQFILRRDNDKFTSVQNFNYHPTSESSLILLFDGSLVNICPEELSIWRFPRLDHVMENSIDNEVSEKCLCM